MYFFAADPYIGVYGVVTRGSRLRDHQYKQTS